MAKKLADQTGGISTGYDDARMTIHGTRANQTRFPEVHKLTMSRLKKANPKNPRILDNTNVNPRFKKSTDDALRHEAGFKDPITSMTPRTSIRAAFRRNSRRGPNEQVPRTVMRIMAKQYKNYRNSNEGQQATRTGDALTKQYALNRRTGNSRRSNAERTRRSNQD